MDLAIFFQRIVNHLEGLLKNNELDGVDYKIRKEMGR